MLLGPHNRRVISVPIRCNICMTKYIIRRDKVIPCELLVCTSFILFFRSVTEQMFMSFPRARSPTTTSEAGISLVPFPQTVCIS